MRTGLSWVTMTPPTIILVWPASIIFVLILAPSVFPSYILRSYVPKSNVTVFNAFSNREMFASVVFGKSVQNQMNQISYGSYRTAEFASSSEDYVVQFSKLPTGDAIDQFTTYGHLNHIESNIKEVLIIILPSLDGKPDTRVVKFQNHSDGFNRLYFFNAMINSVQSDKGVYIYGLFYRQNYDGSRSQSVSQYANDLPFGEGRESTLFPGTELTIKVFHQAIKSVQEFENGPLQLSNSIQIIGRSNTQSYIILFGLHNNKTEPPFMKALNVEMVLDGNVSLFQTTSIASVIVCYFFFFIV